jgi:hypothetical protein
MPLQDSAMLGHAAQGAFCQRMMARQPLVLPLLLLQLIKQQLGLSFKRMCYILNSVAPQLGLAATGVCLA